MSTASSGISVAMSTPNSMTPAQPDCLLPSFLLRDLFECVTASVNAMVNASPKEKETVIAMIHTGIATSFACRVEPDLRWEHIKPELKCLVGQVLTIIDGALPQGPQNKAVKDMIRQAFGMRMNAIHDMTGRKESEDWPYLCGERD